VIELPKVADLRRPSAGPGHNKSNMLHLLLCRHPKKALVAPQTRRSRRGGTDARGAGAQAPLRLSLCNKAGLVPHLRGTPITSASMPGASQCIASLPETSGGTCAPRTRAQYPCALESASGRPRTIVLFRVGAHP